MGARLKPKRRIGAEHSAKRAAILDATQALMVSDGYAAVSARRVAAAAGLKPALVQYYFPAMDDLLLAVYRRSADQVAVRQAEALASDTPLQALWALSADGERAALGVEFMALANHRKAIRSEISRYVDRAREQQVEALSRLVPECAGEPGFYPPAGVALLLAAAARALVMEAGLGISLGHAEARGIIERWSASLEGSAKVRPISAGGETGRDPD